MVPGDKEVQIEELLKENANLNGRINVLRLEHRALEATIAELRRTVSLLLDKLVNEVSR